MNRGTVGQAVAGVVPVAPRSTGVAASQKGGNSDDSEGSHRGCHSGEDDLRENPGHNPADEENIRDPRDNNPDGSYSVITNETKACTQDAWRIGSIPYGGFVDSCR